MFTPVFYQEQDFVPGLSVSPFEYRNSSCSGGGVAVARSALSGPSLPTEAEEEEEEAPLTAATEFGGGINKLQSSGEQRLWVLHAAWPTGLVEVNSSSC